MLLSRQPCFSDCTRWRWRKCSQKASTYYSAKCCVLLLDGFDWMARIGLRRCDEWITDSMWLWNSSLFHHRRNNLPNVEAKVRLHLFLKQGRAKKGRAWNDLESPLPTCGRWNELAMTPSLFYRQTSLIWWSDACGPIGRYRPVGIEQLDSKWKNFRPQQCSGKFAMCDGNFHWYLHTQQDHCFTPVASGPIVPVNRVESCKWCEMWYQTSWCDVGCDGCNVWRWMMWWHVMYDVVTRW